MKKAPLKKISILAMALIISGCTHYSISNQSLLTKPQAVETPKTLQAFPLNIEASMSCYETRIGHTIKKKCSNKGRLKEVVKLFKERGYQATPTEDKSAPTISVKKESINGFVENLTGFFNIITLGLAPLYHYDDYIVTYNDPKNNVTVSQEVRVSSRSWWVSLFMSNPEGLEGNEIKSRAEENLIRSVLSEAAIQAK